MKQIVIISGKGGTGKTVITASFAALARNHIMADCDVDAADLHLLLEPTVSQTHEFKSGLTAQVDPSQCTRCGQCRQICRFQAIDEHFQIDPIACEGCAFCSHVCPLGAITMKENTAGEWFISETRFGMMVHAKLGVAEENSGKLVSLVRSQAKELAAQKGCDWVIIDGSPGIGCPVIASLSGVDCAVVVTEPTLSGLHDALRVIEVAGHFHIPTKVIINKYDLNPQISQRLADACGRKGADVIGKIRFDKSIVHAMVQRKTVIEAADGIIQKEVTDIWERLQKEILKGF